MGQTDESASHLFVLSFPSGQWRCGVYELPTKPPFSLHDIGQNWGRAPSAFIETKTLVWDMGIVFLKAPAAKDGLCVWSNRGGAPGSSGKNLGSGYERS